MAQIGIRLEMEYYLRSLDLPKEKPRTMEVAWVMSAHPATVMSRTICIALSSSHQEMIIPMTMIKMIIDLSLSMWRCAMLFVCIPDVS